MNVFLKNDALCFSCLFNVFDVFFLLFDENMKKIKVGHVNLPAIKI
jgi:hypothetical protein